MADVDKMGRGLPPGEEPVAPLPPAHTRSASDGSQSFAEGNNAFALAMYRRLRQQPGNLIFAPFGIRTALSMALAGARGETAAQMREVLHIASSDEALHAALAGPSHQPNAADGDEDVMDVANSLWGQDGEPLQSEFVDLIARHGHGELNLVDFRRDAEAARTIINRWVEGRTRRRIRELIPAGGLSALTRLVLVNAVYFSGKWAEPFRVAATRDEPFHLDSGEVVDVPLMYQKADVPYLQARGYQAVDLPYRGGGLSLLLILPDPAGKLGDLEEALSPRMIDECVTKMQTTEVKLYLPRFSFTSRLDRLIEDLTSLGMPFAFDRRQADFSGINGHRAPDPDGLFVCSVLHNATVEVDEAGTRAAASTAVISEPEVMLDRKIPPPTPIFRADRPFLFAIRERTSDALLFLGRVLNPTGVSDN